MTLRAALLRTAFLSALFLFHAASEAAAQVAELYSAEGQVEGQIAPQPSWTPIGLGQKFSEQDAIRTLNQSRAGVKFTNGYLVRMNEKTVINFSTVKPQGGGRGRMSVLQGISHFFSRDSKDFPDVRTPHVSASVRGTEFVVAVQDDATVISVMDGAVLAENQFGSVDLGKGEQAIARAGAAPVKQIMVRPNDAVQWALYYPAVFHPSDFTESLQAVSPEERRGFEALERGEFEVADKAFRGAGSTSALGRAMVAYRFGDARAAVAELRRSPGEQTVEMNVLEASLLLSKGQVEQASSLLDGAERRLGGSGGSRLQPLILAQRAVVLLVKGEKDEAERAAVSSALDAKLAAGTLALSYVRQSQFRLEEAESLLEETIRRAPTNSIARARLAEIQLAFGRRDEALRTAEAALTLDPENAYVLSVIGFAELTRLNTSTAETYFRRAIAADSGFALGMLGLGLTQIRQGGLEQGRASLEQAVQLDPNVSLYRSYLGKAYYEEEREHLSFGEYDRAISLDPLDPTPYLYRSFAKLSAHRPVEALEDLQESIERNNNRAVFRSRLLLDQDAGTRSSGLGQIYSRLGFNELARVEATKALNRDYSNYSAHFLLADLYRDTHLNSRAQVTENLLGRLLSPVTFNANDVNLGGEASLTEYTTLFDRPEKRVKAEGYARSQTEAFGARTDYTMATERLGFNLGYAGSYRDGFRENDWLRTHQLFNLGQYAATADDTLAWDAALTASDQGDIIINNDPYSEDPDFESKFDGALARIGYHRRLSPGTKVIAQAFYNYGDFDGSNDLNDRRLPFLDVTKDGVPVSAEPFFLDTRTNEDTDIEQHLGRADVQLIWDSEAVSVVAGTSASAESLDSSEDAVVSDPGSEPALAFLNGFPITSESSVDEYSSQTFLYTTFHVRDWLDVQSGITYNYLDYSDNAFTTPFSEESYTKDQWGPKAGILADVTEWVSLRLAYSRSLDRTGRSGLGPLEPTFVSGFNQVFDAVRGSEQDLYAAGLDFELGKRTFAGVSYQRREVDLNVPVVLGGLTIERNGLIAEQSSTLDRLAGKAEVDRVGTYLYRLFGSSFAGLVDYAFERFDEQDPFPETQTNRLRTELRYFHPNGLFAFGDATFRYQERAGLQDPKETADFWILGMGVGYELDHQHGVVSLRAENLLDEEFRYSAIADEDPVLPKFGMELAFSVNF